MLQLTTENVREPLIYGMLLTKIFNLLSIADSDAHQPTLPPLGESPYETLARLNQHGKRSSSSSQLPRSVSSRYVQHDSNHYESPPSHSSTSIEQRVQQIENYVGIIRKDTKRIKRSLKKIIRYFKHG